MSEPTNATDAVQRLEKAIALKPSSGMALVPVDAVMALLARLADVEAENADLWTELNLCRQMCRDSQPARLSGDAHGP